MIFFHTFVIIVNTTLPLISTFQAKQVINIQPERSANRSGFYLPVITTCSPSITKLTGAVASIILNKSDKGRNF